MERILYGNKIADGVKQHLKDQIVSLVQSKKPIPHLVVILVGSNPSSISYVRGKQKACQEIGMRNTLITMPEDTKQKDLLETIKRLNIDEEVDCILVQLPLPSQINEKEILGAIHPEKDVDGFHPYNIGRLLVQEETVIPCTPKGILKMLDSIGYEDLSGKHAVIIGRSNIVGKPIGQLLLHRNATVTMCHSKTKQLPEIVKHADLVVVAIGKAKFVKADWIQKGAVVIDVGINRHEEYGICGDVDFENVLEKVSYITPVPKGVGPMTVAMLLENTLDCYYKRRG